MKRRHDGRKLSYCQLCIKEIHLWLKYGITQEDYNKLLKRQKHKCAICKEARRLQVDHNHKSKKVRGLLCQRCNSLVGFVDKYPHLLNKAIKYVDKAA